MKLPRHLRLLLLLTCLVQWPILPAQQPELIPQVVQGNAFEYANTLTFGSSQEWLALTSAQGAITIYEIATGRISRTIDTGAANPLIAARPGRDSLAILAPDLALSLYDVKADKTLWKSSLPENCVAIHFNRDGSRLFAVCGQHRGISIPLSARMTIRIWDADTGSEVPGPTLPDGISARGPFSEDGRWVAGNNIPPHSANLFNYRKFLRTIENTLVLDTQTGQPVGAVKSPYVLAISASAHSALVLDLRLSGARNTGPRDIALVDILTSNTKQFVEPYPHDPKPLAALAALSVQVSPDGQHFLVIEPGGVATLIDAATAAKQRPPWHGLPAISVTAFAPDLDRVAFSQAGAIFVTSLSHPEHILTIGNPDAPAHLSEALKQSGVTEAAEASPTSAPSPIRQASKSSLQLPGSKRKQIQAQFDQQLADEYQAIESSQRSREKAYFDYLSRFGSPTLIPPAAAFIDSNRLLAVRCADGSWGLWDVATGNHLPYRKPLDDLSDYRYANKNPSSWLNPSDLREIEKDFAVPPSSMSPDAPLPQTIDGAAASYSPDHRQYFVAVHPPGSGDDETPAPGLRVFDAASHQRLFVLPEAFPTPSLLAAAPSGRVLVGPDRNSTLGLWDRGTGVRIGTLYALQEGEWLLTTPSGLFDGSPRGWSEIAWRESTGSLSTLPAEAFFNEFYRPGLLAEILDGNPPEPPRTIAQVDRRPPLISLIGAPAATPLRTATLHLALSEPPATGLNPAPGGLRDVRLFRNGTLVKAWRGDLTLTAGHIELTATIPLIAGINRFTAYAFNRDNVKSTDAAFTIQCTDAPRKGIAWIIAVGLNQYSNPEFNLNFAEPDARHLSEKLAQTQQDLGTYRQVVITGLFNHDATRANILRALSILGGHDSGSESVPALATLHAAQPEDTVILYFAGHGVASRDRFYLIPHDLSYQGPRNEIESAAQQILSSGISDLDLEHAFEPIDAAHTLLIIDACDSGKVLDTREARRGPMNSKGLAQLAYEKGIYILTASQAYQAALESFHLGYGYLTFALAQEGLNSSIADTAPTDGKITVAEWFDYAARRVPQMQSEELNHPSPTRAIAFEARSSSQPSADPAAGPSAPGRLQTPRVYYRRDQHDADAIIYRPQPH